MKKIVIKDRKGIEVEIDINEFAHHIEEYLSLIHI